MASEATSSKRLLSLDVFRGFTVASMILVNNPGDWGHIYPPLKHAEWHGCTPTDLIFPFFLFIVGVSIVFAFDSKRKQESSKLIKNILKRSILLFGLGLILSLFPFFNFYEVRIPGVLQRIALVYFVTAILFIKFSRKSILNIFVGILILYWFLMTFVPVPDFGPANLEKETNLGAWLDRLLFSENHLWTLSKTWDPEGLLSSLPAISTGLFGILMGIILKSKVKTGEEKVSLLFFYGFSAFVLGLIWSLFFPINKSLWTSSYVLYTGGLATMSLAFCFWMIDVKGHHRFTKPFVVYGVNALIVFFASGIIARSMNLIKVNFKGEEVSFKIWIYEQLFTPYLSPINASLAWAISFVLVWLLILWLMYRKNIIIKV